MATKTETRHTGEFLLSEGNGNISREGITVLQGEDLQAGAVVGKITASNKYVEYNPGASDGSESVAGILYERVNAVESDYLGTVVTQKAEVSLDFLVWGDTLTGGEITTGLAELEALKILARA